MSLFKSMFLFHIILIAALKILRTRTQGGCLISGAEGVIGAQLASGRELKGAPASTSPAGKLPLPADSQGPEFFIVRKFSWAYADATSIQLPTFVLLSGAPRINLLFVPPLCTLHELRMTIPTSALLRSFLPHETGFLEFLPSWLPSLLVEQDTDHQFPPPPLFIAVFLIMNPKIEFVCLFWHPHHTVVSCWLVNKLKPQSSCFLSLSERWNIHFLEISFALGSLFQRRPLLEFCLCGSYLKHSSLPAWCRPRIMWEACCRLLMCLPRPRAWRGWQIPHNEFAKCLLAACAFKAPWGREKDKTQGLAARRGPAAGVGGTWVWPLTCK